MTKSNSKHKCVKKTQENENRQSANEQFFRRVQLLAVASNNIYSLGRENICYGELGSTRQATKNTCCGELGTTRWASDDICSLGEVEHSPWRATTDRSTNRPLFSLQNPNFDNPNPKIDRKHYLRLFYNLLLQLQDWRQSGYFFPTQLITT